MLFFISLFLGRQALRVFRPSTSLLVALVLVMRLLFIDVVAVDPVHGRIKEEISLSASYTDDHDMRLSLIVGGEIFCFHSQCPHQPDPSTLVVLGDAYFENDEQRTWFHDHVRIGDPGDQKGKQKEVHEREQKEQQESSEKNVAFQTWEHVGAAMKVLEMFGLIMQDTMESWSEKLEVAEKSTKIDEATWFSWQLRLKISLVQYYYLSEPSWQYCLQIGPHTYCLVPIRAANSARDRPPLHLHIGYATFANAGTREGVLNQVDRLLKTTDKDTMTTWLDAMKKDAEINMEKTSRYFIHLAYSHKIMSLLHDTRSGLDHPLNVITEETWQYWKEMMSENVASLEEEKKERKRGQARQRFRERYKLDSDFKAEVIERSRVYRATKKQRGNQGGPS